MGVSDHPVESPAQPARATACSPAKTGWKLKWVGCSILLSWH